MTLKSALALSLLFSGHLTSSALAQTVTCQMDVRPARYYIAPEISMTLGDPGEVTVRDAIIASTGRKFVRGSVAKNDAKRLSITWEAKNVPKDPTDVRAHLPHLIIRLTVLKADGAARMTIQDGFYLDRGYRSTGKCRFSE